jgi:hypothetical protein
MSAETNVTDSGWKSAGMASGDTDVADGVGDGATATMLGDRVGELADED